MQTKWNIMQSIKIIALQHINVNKLSHINGKMISQVIFYRCINVYVLLVCIYIPYMDVYVHANLLQSFSTLCDPMDCSLPGSSVHRIFQARNVKKKNHQMILLLTCRMQIITIHIYIYMNICMWVKYIYEHIYVDTSYIFILVKKHWYSYCNYFLYQ